MTFPASFVSTCQRVVAFILRKSFSFSTVSTLTPSPSPCVRGCLIFVTCFHFFHFVLWVVACLLAFLVSSFSRCLFAFITYAFSLHSTQTHGHICECMWRAWIYLCMQSAFLYFDVRSGIRNYLWVLVFDSILFSPLLVLKFNTTVKLEFVKCNRKRSCDEWIILCTQFLGAE